MGWDCVPGWNRKQTITDALRSPVEWDGSDGMRHRREVVKIHDARDVVWTQVREYVQMSADGSWVPFNYEWGDMSPYIVGHLLRREKGDWHIRQVTEMEGPYQFSCPVEWFDEVPLPDRGSDHAYEWREKCRFTQRNKGGAE